MARRQVDDVECSSAVQAAIGLQPFATALAFRFVATCELNFAFQRICVKITENNQEPNGY